VQEHRDASPATFTGRFHVDRLVYCEEYQDVHDALRREKQIKGWLRVRKIALIESVNPGWNDLSGWL
jgi:putative endonuclease